MILLNNWSVQSFGDMYTAPELVEQRLCGDAVGHPTKGDKAIITSRIVKVAGRTVTTASGSVYKLGKIDKAYREFIRTTTPDWNWRNPIKVRP